MAFLILLSIICYHSVFASTVYAQNLAPTTYTVAKSLHDTLPKTTINRIVQMSDSDYSKVGHLVGGRMRWGIMDSLKNIIIPPAYSDIEQIRQAFIVSQRDSVGLIDKKGQWILPIKYQHIEVFMGRDSSTIWKTTSKCGKELFNFEGKPITESCYDVDHYLNDFDYFRSYTNLSCSQKAKQDYIVICKGNTTQVYTTKGEKLLPHAVPYPVVLPRLDGYFDIFESSDSIPEIKYYIDLLDKYTGRWGIMDSLGNVVMPCKYIDKVIGLTNCWIAFDSNYKVFDKSGKLLDSYNNTVPFGWYKAAMVQRDNKWGMIDSYGKIAYPITLDKYESYTEKSVVAVQQDSTWGLLDHKGTWLVAPIYIDIHWAVERRECVSYIVQPYLYIRQTVTDATNHYSTINWGIVDTTGKILVPAVYKGLAILFSLRNELPYEAVEYQNDSPFIGLLTINNQSIVPTNYQCISISNPIPAISIDTLNYPFLKRYILARTAFKQDVYDIDGQLVWSFQDDNRKSCTLYNHYDKVFWLEATEKIIFYDATTSKTNTFDKSPNDVFYYHYYHAPFHLLERGSKKGLLNMLGKMVLPCEFDDIEIDAKQQKISAKQGNKTTLFDYQGKKIRSH